MEIRSFTKQDIPKVASLLRETWKQERHLSLSLEQVKKYLRYHDGLSQDISFVAVQGTTIIGSLRLASLYKGVAELRDFIVSPGYRGQGVGHALLLYAIQWGKKQKLHKLYTLEAPLKKAFFTSYGFVDEGFLRDHFFPGEDLVFLSFFFAYPKEVQQDLGKQLKDIEQLQNVEYLTSQQLRKLHSKKVTNHKI